MPLHRDNNCLQNKCHKCNRLIYKNELLYHVNSNMGSSAFGQLTEINGVMKSQEMMLV